MSTHLDYEINKELGECYLFMGDIDKAEEYYVKAAKSNGVHPEPYIGLATIAVHRGQNKKALDLYGKAAEIEPNDKALSGMGLMLTEAGRHEEAFENYAKALNFNPENMVATFGLIQLGHALHRLDEVIPYLENFLSVAPEKDDVRFALSGCLVGLGRSEDARSHLEIILEHDPSNESCKELYESIAA